MSPPLAGCTAAWRASWPDRASQQALAEPGDLAKVPAVSSQPHVPGSFVIDDQPQASGDTLYFDRCAQLDGEEDSQLYGIAQRPESDPRLVQDLEGGWEADIREQCSAHASLEGACLPEQTHLWSHSKLE